MPPQFCFNKWRGECRTLLGSTQVEIGPGWRALEVSVLDILNLRCRIYTQVEIGVRWAVENTSLGLRSQRLAL